MKTELQKVPRKTHGVNWEQDVLRAAREKARERRQSLSAYVNDVVVRDVGCEPFTPKQPAKRPA